MSAQTLMWATKASRLVPVRTEFLVAPSCHYVWPQSSYEVPFYISMENWTGCLATAAGDELAGKSVWIRLASPPEGGAEAKVSAAINSTSIQLDQNPLCITSACIPGRNTLIIRNPQLGLLSVNLQVEVKTRRELSQVVAKIPYDVHSSLDLDALSLTASPRGGDGNAHDGDAQIITLAASRTCPITLQEIQVPVRGRLCQHPQNFDAHSFLTLACDTGSWRCPICGYIISTVPHGHQRCLCGHSLVLNHNHRVPLD